MRRRIAAVGPLASESSSHRGPFLEDFRNLTATVAKYSLVRARQNPCAAGTGTVFSQTLCSHYWGVHGRRRRAGGAARSVSEFHRDSFHGADDGGPVAFLHQKG